MTTEPSALQLHTFRQADQEQPINMVNLLKFRDHANYAKTDTEALAGLSGREAYALYAKVALEKIKQNGGRIDYLSPSEQCFVGDDKDDWDQVVVVHYKSRADYLKGFDSKEYQAAIRHRVAGLQKRVLLQCPTNQIKHATT